LRFVYVKAWIVFETVTLCVVTVACDRDLSGQGATLLEILDPRRVSLLVLALVP
jgi:hypothetical protein